METLFENKYTKDKTSVREYLNYFYWKKPILLMLNILFALLFVFTIVSIFLPAIFPYNNDLKALYIVLPLFIWTVNITRYFKALKLSVMRDREINNGNPIDMHYIVSDDKVEVHCESIETKNSVSIFQVKKVVKTKNFIILVTEAKLSFVLKKDSFIKGTPEELIEFLKSKGLKI